MLERLVGAGRSQAQPAMLFYATQPEWLKPNSHAPQQHPPTLPARICIVYCKDRRHSSSHSRKARPIIVGDFWEHQDLRWVVARHVDLHRTRRKTAFRKPACAEPLVSQACIGTFESCGSDAIIQLSLKSMPSPAFVRLSQAEAYNTTLNSMLYI